MSFILEPRFLFDASVGTTGNAQHEHHHTHHDDNQTPDSGENAPSAPSDGNSGGNRSVAEPTTTTAHHHGSRAGDDRGNATTTATVADTSPSAQAQNVDTILFVDPRVADWQQLAGSVSASTKVIVIDPNKDGLTQVTHALSHFSNIKEVDFLTYGQSGQIELGSSPITDAVLNAKANEVAGWSNSFAANAQIQFWGCDVGAGEAGQAFVADLHAITGAGVAASTDATGAAALGADWTLERTAGVVTAHSPFSLAAEANYSGVLDVPLPQVTFSNVPSEVLLGTGSFTETITFKNGAATAVGYGPFIELFVPNSAASGTSETLLSATYLGTAVSVQTVTLSDTIAGHLGVVGAVDPLYLNASGAGQFVAAPTGFHAGDTMYVLTLPFGSFTPSQPSADIVLTFSNSNHSNLGSNNVNIAAVAGFEYGADPLNNPSTDPAIRGTDGTTGAGQPQAGDGLAVAQSSLTLLNVDTSVNYHEGETATGQDFPGQYTINLTPAPATNGDPLSNLVFTVELPTDVVWTGGAINATGGGVVGAVTGGTLGADGLVHGGHFTVTYAQLASASATATGVASTITVPFYVPEHDTGTGQVLTPGTGNGWQSVNVTPFYSYTASDWSPVAGAFTTTAQQVSDSGAGTGADVDFTAKTLAIQVSDTDITSGGTALLPGDVYKYTINFQVSDYYDLTNLVLNDVLGDGMTLLVDGTHTPSLTINNNGANSTTSFTTLSDAGTTVNGQNVVTSNTTAADWNYTRNNTGTSTTVNGSSLAAGSTAIQFNVSQLLGNAVIVGDNDHNSGGTTGSITFYAQALQKYTQTLGQQSIRENDSVSNSVNGTATATGNDSASTPISLRNTNQTGAVSDSSSVTNTEAAGAISLVISDVNGTDVTSASTVHFQAGDQITYTLTYTLTAGDYGDLDLNAFLPLPVFAVPTSLTADGSAGVDNHGNVVPASGKFVVTSNPSASPSNDPSTASSINNANGIQFSFGTYDTTNGAAGQTVVVKFTLTASNSPFADGLALTTQAQSSYTNAGGALLNNAVIKQQVMDAPELSIRTGVVSVTGDTGTAKASGTGTGQVSYTGDSTNSTANADPTTSFLAAGTADNAAGTIDGVFANQTALTALDTASPQSAVDQNVARADGGDTVRVVQTVTNAGKGDAYNVVVSGSPPTGYSATDVGEIRVVRGDGTVLENITNSTEIANFFTATTGVTISNGASPVLYGKGSTTGAANSNVLYVVYDVKLTASATQAVQAQTLTATGSIVQFYASTTTTDPTTHASLGFVTGGGTAGAFAIGDTGKLSDTATVGMQAAAFSKALTAGDDSTNVPLSSVVVGETLTYTFTLTVPEGEMTSVNFSDTMKTDAANGLYFDPSSIAVVSAPTFSNANITSSLGDISGAISINHTTGAITANFGDVTNSNHDATATITFQISVKVANSTNANGTAINNSAKITSGNGADLTSMATATEKDPGITETITVVDATTNQVVTAPYSGETLKYTITYTYNGTAPVQDLADTIVVSNNLSSLSNITGGGTNETGASNNVAFTGNSANISATQITSGGSATFTFTAVVNNDLTQNSAITVSTGNSNAGTFTSMPGAVAGERTYQTSATKTINVSQFTPNIYIVDQSNSTEKTDSSNSASLTPTLTHPVGSADTTVGEIVRMVAYVEVPYGQNATTLEVALPKGLMYLNDGSTTFAFFSQNAGQLVSTDNNDVTGATGYQLTDNTTGSFNPAARAGEIVAALPNGTGTTITQTNAGQTDTANVVSFNFGHLQDNSTSAAAAGYKNYVAVEFNALVTNVADNHASGTPTALTTSVAVNATPNGTPSTTLTVKEPAITVTKTITDINESTGVVTWSITVTNGSTNSTTAYNVTVDDPLTANQDTLTNTGSLNGGTNASTASEYKITGLTLAAGASDTFTYTTHIVSPTTPVANDKVTVTWSSLSNSTSINSALATDGSSNVTFHGSAYGTTGALGNAATGTVDGSRDGSNTLPVDTYSASAQLGIGVVTGVLWDDVGDPLAEAGDSPSSVTDHALATLLNNYGLTASWAGQTVQNSATATTNSSGVYSFLLPSNVTVTITAPTTNGGETLVYSTNGSTFNRNPSGTGTQEGALSTNTLSLTPTAGSTTSGYNFAYRQQDTAPTITANADTTKVSWGNTAVADTYTMGGSAIALTNANATVADTQLDRLVSNGLGDYSGAVLTIARDSTVNANDLFGGTGLLTLSGGATPTSSGTISYNGTQIGTYDNATTAGQLKITLGAGTNATTVQNILNNLSYKNTGSNTQLAAGILLDATLSDHNTLTGNTPGNTYQGLGGTKTSLAAQIMLNLAPAAAAATYTEPNNTSGTPTAQSAAVTIIPSGSSVTVANTTYQTVVLQITNVQSAEDVLAFTNTTNIHGSYDASTGKLTLTNQGAASTSDWAAALNAVTYYDSSNTPVSTTRAISILATTAGGDTVSGTFSNITVVPVNDSPVLGASLTSTITENSPSVLNSGPSSSTDGFLVSAFAKSGTGGNITDVDLAGDHDGGTGGTAGIVITQADTTQGDWYYELSSQGSTTWVKFASSSMTAVSNSNALHLLSTDRIFFEPTQTTSASVNPALSFRAWDQYSPSAAISDGAFANIGSTGFGTGTNTSASAYSSAVDTVSLIVPLSLNQQTVTFTEPNNPSGTPTDASAEVSLLGNITASTNFSSVTVTLSNYTSAEDVIAFTANAGTMGDITLGSNANGVITLTSAGGATAAQWQTALRAIEYYDTNNTPTSTVTTARSVSISATFNGGTTFTNSSASSLTVSPTNDSPVLGAPLNSTLSVSEDSNAVGSAPTSSSSGILVSSFAKAGAGGNITDPDLAGDANGSTTGYSAGAIAIVQADTSEGNWWYSTNGGSTWTEFAGTGVTNQPSATNALHLTSSDLLYFEPTVAHWAGTINPALSFRAWDGFDSIANNAITDGSITNINTNGGNYGTNAPANSPASAYSVATDTLSLNIAQTFDLSPVLKIVDESNGTEAADSNNSATLTPSQTNNVGTSDATIGEIVRMKVYVQAPTGQNNIQVQLDMPTGLEFLNDGSERLALTAASGTLTSSTETGASDTQGTGFNVATYNPTHVFSDTSKITTSGNTVTFDLGNVGNTDASSASNYVVIEFNALVKNVSTNVAGTDLATTAKVVSTGNTSSDTVHVVEPNVTITKTITSIDQTTGTVTWQEVVTNTGTTTAYGISINDPNASANEGHVFGLTQSGDGTNINITSGNVDNVTNLFAATLDLAKGKSETFTYQTRVTGSVLDADAKVTDTYQSLNEQTPVDGTRVTISGGNVSFYGSTYGTGSGSTATHPGHDTAGNVQGMRNSNTSATGGAANTYTSNAATGIGLISGKAWNSVDEDLTQPNEGPTGPDDTPFAGVTITPTWSGQTTTLSTTTDATGAYSVLVPDNVPVTVTATQRLNGQMLVYDTSDGTTFNTDTGGLTGSRAGITVTATPGTTITDINFAYKPIPAVVVPPPGTPYLDPINTSPQMMWANLGSYARYWQGGLEPDWLVGSDVFRVLEAGIPGTANVSADVFYGSAPKQDLSYEAKSISGGSLPPWLFFDPNLLRFTGTPPEGMEGSVDVKVIATDRKGREATAEVHIRVVREPANLLSLLVTSKPVSGEPELQGNGQQRAPEETPVVVPPAATPPVQGPTPAPTTNDGAGTPSVPAPATNDNAPQPSPSPQGMLERGLFFPTGIERSAQGFGLSRQLREQSAAGRLAKSRSLLNALSEKRAAL